MSNTINIVQGTTKKLVVQLVDKDGQPVRLWKLQGATAELNVRVSTTSDTDTIQFTTTANPTSLSFAGNRPAINITFEPGDTAGLTVQTYFYQLVVTLADGTVLDAIPWDLFNVTLGGSSSVAPPVFSSTVAITQDYPLPGAMLYQSPGGCGIEGAQIRVFLLSDYQAGNYNNPVGVSITGPGGVWVNPVFVEPGFTYISVFAKYSEFGPDTYTFFA
jgi:hypothetical protein